MRIIAGEFRGRTLRAPAGLRVRPTSDALRETLFNVLGPGLEGAWVLDLYAGSGAVGLEALSRGAARALFVEQSRAAAAALLENLSRLGLQAKRSGAPEQAERSAIAGQAMRARLLREPVLRVLYRLAADAEWGAHGVDLIFLDPPYAAAGEYAQAMPSLASSICLRAHTRVVAEHAARNPLAPRYGRLLRVRELRQGDSALSFYEVQAAHS